MLLEFLNKKYKPGEPILLQNLNFDMKYDNLCQQMKKLVDGGFLCRYMDGVYYLPKKTLSGIPYTLNADTVVELKYLGNKTDNYGCYTGHTLANMMGLSEQIPQIKEIVSNNTSAITRKVKVGKFSYIIRKPAVKVTKENVKTVMLLEVLKDIENLADSHINSSECLKNYIAMNKIKKSQVDKILPSYPLRTYKAIYDMELSNVFA